MLIPSCRRAMASDQLNAMLGLPERGGYTPEQVGFRRLGQRRSRHRKVWCRRRRHNPNNWRPDSRNTDNGNANQGRRRCATSVGPFTRPIPTMPCFLEEVKPMPQNDMLLSRRDERKARRDEERAARLAATCVYRQMIRPQPRLPTLTRRPQTALIRFTGRLYQFLPEQDCRRSRQLGRPGMLESGAAEKVNERLWAERLQANARLHNTGTGNQQSPGATAASSAAGISANYEHDGGHKQTMPTRQGFNSGNGFPASATTLANAGQLRDECWQHHQQRGDCTGE